MASSPFAGHRLNGNYERGPSTSGLPSLGAYAGLVRACGRVRRHRPARELALHSMNAYLHRPPPGGPARMRFLASILELAGCRWVLENRSCGGTYRAEPADRDFGRLDGAVELWDRWGGSSQQSHHSRQNVAHSITQRKSRVQDVLTCKLEAKAK